MHHRRNMQFQLRICNYIGPSTSSLILGAGPDVWVTTVCSNCKPVYGSSCCRSLIGHVYEGSTSTHLYILYPRVLFRFEGRGEDPTSQHNPESAMHNQSVDHLDSIAQLRMHFSLRVYGDSRPNLVVGCRR